MLFSINRIFLTISQIKPKKKHLKKMCGKRMKIKIMISGNSTTCRQINNHASMRDVQWKTQNCLMTFETIGIWPETVDGTDLGRDHLIFF